MQQVYRYIGFISILLLSTVTLAQTTALQKRLNFEVEGRTLQQTLNLLGDKADLSFAYNADLIPTDSLITYSVIDRSVDDILQDLLGSYVNYTVVGGHIVFQAKQPELVRSKSSFAVSGQVYSATTGRSLKDVSIYSNVKLKSGITDGSGSYDLKLVHRVPMQTIRISKIGYQDTTLVVSLSQIYNLDIKLMPLNTLTEDVGSVSDGKPIRNHLSFVEQLKLVKLFTNRKQRVNAVNISDSITRPVQFSLLPILGTNFRMSGVVTNNLSLNLIGGYNGGVKGVELAVGFNIVRKQMLGLQMATAMNIVGGDVHGCQFSSALNLNLKDMKGWQATAFLNIQVKNFKGLQTAVFMNFTGSTISGIQVAAGVNYADTVVGVQATSGINIAKSQVNGIQISAGINYTKHLKGVQIGIINIADTATGIPIGLLSIVRKGYWHFDVYADELTYVNASIRTGVSYFHNIVTVGYAWSAPTALWRVGYGLGTEYKFGKKDRGFINADVTVSYINRGSKFITDLNLLTTVNWDIGFRVKEHFGFFVGPTVKIYYSRYLNPNTNERGLDIGFNPQVNEVKDGLLNQMWVGFRGGFRF